MRYLLTLVFLFAASGHPAAQNVTDQHIKEGQRRITAWRECTVSSFAHHARSVDSPHLAVEVAFESCTTEERAAKNVMGFVGQIDDQAVNAIFVELRSKQKADLIGGYNLYKRAIGEQ